jgi:hypothetical protein
MSSQTYRQDGNIGAIYNGYRTYRTDGDVAAVHSGYRTYRTDGDVAAVHSGYRTYRTDGDVAAVHSGYRTYRTDGDVAAVHSGYRTHRIDGDVPAIHSVQRTYQDFVELPPITIPTSSPQYIVREPSPRPSSRHRVDTDSEASVSTKKSRRTTKAVRVYPKVAESESVWTPFGTLGSKKKKKSKR